MKPDQEADIRDDNFRGRGGEGHMFEEGRAKSLVAESNSVFIDL